MSLPVRNFRRLQRPILDPGDGVAPYPISESPGDGMAPPPGTSAPQNFAFAPTRKYRPITPEFAQAGLYWYAP